MQGALRSEWREGREESSGRQVSAEVRVVLQQQWGQVQAQVGRVQAQDCIDVGVEDLDMVVVAREKMVAHVRLTGKK